MWIALLHTFEAALGANVIDPFHLYETIEANSLAAVRAALGAPTDAVAT